MNPIKRKEINFLAQTILEGLELQTPVDVEMAVIRLGGQLDQDSTRQTQSEALIEKAGERFRIVLCTEPVEVRKRFSIAHELGHLFLHMGYLVDPDMWMNSRIYHDSVFYRFGYGVEEAEANEFAAAFLMPKDEFLGVAELNTNNGCCSIQAIADHFRTSREAALNRGRVLGLFQSE